MVDMAVIADTLDMDMIHHAFSVSKSLMRHEYRSAVWSANVQLFFSLFCRSKHRKKNKSPSQRLVQATDDSLNTGNHVLCVSQCYIVCHCPIWKRPKCTTSHMMFAMALPGWIWHLKSHHTQTDSLKHTARFHWTMSPEWPRVRVLPDFSGAAAPSWTKRFIIGVPSTNCADFLFRSVLGWNGSQRCRLGLRIASYDQPCWLVGCPGIVQKLYGHMFWAL